ncbi:hypothetical protein [Sulfitobacter sp. JB4-11]|uniref:hypothetical protein n=1 Tax=Sulfitobacter rhodophyticola TaxID=3238304 RepID=UPI003518A0EE
MTDHVQNENLKIEDTPADPVETAGTDADAPLDDASMDAIRSLLAEETKAPVAAPASAKRSRKADAQPVDPEPAPCEADAKTGRAARRILPPIAAPEKEAGAAPRPAKKPRGPGLVSKATAPLMARIKGYRPTPKHMTLAALALLVLFRPGLVIGIVLLTLFIFVGVFLVLGYDGFWQRGMALARWYAERNPTRSAALHARLDTFAMKWDAVLDRFPEGTVDGLYLPDFQELQAAEDRHDAALDRRLKDMRETEV